MKLGRTATILVVAMTVAMSASAADFDIKGYCKQVSAAVGGSYQIEASCRQQEGSAKARVAKTKAPADIVGYCEQTGAAVGGSYQIMQACIEQELRAKASLGD